MRRELFALSSFIIYSAFNNIGLSFSATDFPMERCLHIRHDSLRCMFWQLQYHQDVSEAPFRRQLCHQCHAGRCNTVRKALLIQKLMEHHALCVIVKENIIADMFIFFFHFTDSASPQMLRFLYEAVQHLYRCNLFPERVPEYFSPSVLQKLQAFLCRTGSRTSDCSR